MKSARLFFTIALLNLIINSSAQSVLIFEDFETGDFSAKGWYDGFPDQRTVNEFKNGSILMQEILQKAPPNPDQADTCLMLPIKYI